MSSLEAPASSESPLRVSLWKSISSDGSSKSRSSKGPQLKGKTVKHKVGIKTDSGTSKHKVGIKTDSKRRSGTSKRKVKRRSGTSVYSLPHVDAYFTSVHDKGGFDVPPPPVELRYFYSLILPIETVTESLCQALKPLCNAAIAHFNQNEHKQYEFLKLLKANRQGARGAKYYITFEACNLEDGTNQTLQAVVLRGIPKVVGEPNVEVYYCKREADFKGGFYWE